MSDDSAGFTVEYDKRRRIVMTRLWGFWGVGTLAAYTARLLSVVLAARRNAPDFAMFSDSSEFPVQSPLVAAGFTRILQRGGHYHRGKTAIVVASTLNKLQAERSLASPRIRVFLDREQALAWLGDERT